MFGDIIREKFESDVAMQSNVFGFVDHAHAAATELFEDAVVRDGPSDEGVGARHLRAIMDFKLR